MGKIYGLVARNPASNEAVFEEARLQPGERVLDIGSGAGHAMQLARQRPRGGSNGIARRHGRKARRRIGGGGGRR